MIDYLTCPECGITDDICYFSDLYYKDENNSKSFKKQARLQKKLQDLGYNVVTCPNCGQVFIYKIK